MADNGIPPGLHLLKAEEHLLRRVVEESKKKVDDLVDIYEKSGVFQKNLEKFEKELKNDLAEKAKQNKEHIKQLEEVGNYTTNELIQQSEKFDKELKKFAEDSRKAFKKESDEARQSMKRLKDDMDKSLKSYKDFQKQIVYDVKHLKENGATTEEINAYLKKNSDLYKENTQEMTKAIDRVKDELTELSKNENINDETKYVLKKQLLALEKSYDLEEAHFTKQYKIFQEMNDELDSLQKSQEERDKKEKREQKGKFKDTLLTTMLGPFRLLADPINQMLHNNRDTFEQLQHKTEQKEEKFEIYEKSRKELNKLAEEQRENARLEALMSGADASKYEKPSISQAGVNAIRQSFTPKAFISGIQESLGFREPSFEEYSQRANRAEDIDNLKSTFKKTTKSRIKAIPSKIFSGAKALLSGKRGHDVIEGPVAADTPLLPSPIAEEQAIERGHDVIEGPDIMDKISPDQNVLLAKGGAIGAGVVFLAKKLGLITDAFDDAKKKDKDEGGLGKTAMDFIKKNGLSLLKVAAPLAVMAVGGVMVAKGLEMQKRDTDDSKKYFDEGNTARGIETAILGDRARLTEENANRELGRTAGKSALLAGGTGLVAAGGIGTAAMIGTVASAGGVAAAGGLGAVGTAGMAALGAALPPALIAAAVVTAGMVVAKGTQEAFELGWDKNQAAIQKELTDTMLSEDSSTLDKIKAGLESTWKGFTGGLAGGIREAGKVLDAETAIQNEKQINFIKEQAEAGNEGYQRLMEMMSSEQFKALSEAEQKSAMQAEGLYDEFKASQEATRKTLGEHLLTAGKTVGGFFTGLVDTTMEGMRGRETAVWEKAALKGMEDMSKADRDRLAGSDEYKSAIASGKDHKGAMEAAYLKESRDKAVARGDLREDGMAIQEGNWLAGMAAGGAAGLATGGPTGALIGAAGGALGGTLLGKYLGFGDTGMAYKKKQSDEEYRQTFEYTKRKTELMGEGMSAEEADLAAIEEQNTLYEQAMTLRLKQSTDYKKEFDKQVKEGKSLKEAEAAALKAAKENKRNTMTTTELVKDKFHEMGETLKGWAGNLGNFFKEKFSAAGEGLANLGRMVAEGAQGVWNAVSEWFSGIWHGIGDKIKGALGKVSESWDWLKGKAGEGMDWFTGLFSGGDDPATAPSRINDGIVTKDGRVIELSPDDNIYATKNELQSVRDREAQAAMPDVPRTPAEFTDAGIITAIQVLTDVLRSKEMTPQIISQGESVNFDQFRMADVLI